MKPLAVLAPTLILGFTLDARRDMSLDVATVAMPAIATAGLAAPAARLDLARAVPAPAAIAAVAPGFLTTDWIAFNTPAAPPADLTPVHR